MVWQAITFAVVCLTVLSVEVSADEKWLVSVMSGGYMRAGGDRSFPDAGWSVTGVVTHHVADHLDIGGGLSVQGVGIEDVDVGTSAISETRDPSRVALALFEVTAHTAGKTAGVISVGGGAGRLWRGDQVKNETFVTRGAVTTGPAADVSVGVRTTGHPIGVCGMLRWWALGLDGGTMQRIGAEVGITFF